MSSSLNTLWPRLLIGAVVIAFGAWLYSATEWVDVPLPPTPDDAVRKDRLFAAKALLRGLGAQVHSRESLETLPPAGATLVLTSIHWQLFPARVEALRRFVEAGGHLVLPSRLIGTSLHDDDDDDNADTPERSSLKWLGITQEAVPAIDRKPPPENEAGKDEDEARGTARPDTDLSRFRRGTERCIARHEANGSVPMYAPPRSLKLCTSPVRWTKLAGTVTPQWTLQGPSGPEVMRVPVGRGRVTVTMADDLHDNDDLLKADHALLLAATLDLKRGDTVWFIATESRPPLATLLQRHGLAALLAGALALVLALWRGGTRFGPRQAVPPPARRSVREQIAGTAAFIAARGGAPLHRAQLRALEHTASRQLPGYDRIVAPRERAEAIAQVAALDATALAQAMDGTPKRPPRALAAALALMETARRRVQHSTASTPRSTPTANPESNPKARR